MGMTTLLLDVYDGKQFVKDLLWYIYVIMAVAEVLMVLYAVYIAYLFMTASDDGKRRAAKDRLWKVLSSCLIIVALVSVMTTLDISLGDGKKNKETGGLEDIESTEGRLITYTATERSLNYDSRNAATNANSSGTIKTITLSVTFRADQIFPSGSSASMARGIRNFIPNTITDQNANAIMGPSGFPKTRTTGLGDPQIGIEFTQGSSGGVQTLQLRYTYTTGNFPVSFPCYKDEHGKFYITVRISFALMDGGTGEVAVKVPCDQTSGTNSTYFNFVEG